MAQPKLIPTTNVLSLNVAGGLRRQETKAREAKTSNYPWGATQPPLLLTPERLEMIKAYGKDLLRNAEDRAEPRRVSLQAQEVDSPGNQLFIAHAPLIPPLQALAWSIRMLAVVLILVALVPNLLLGALWFGVITPSSRPSALPPAESAIVEAQSAALSPVLSAPSQLEVSAGESAPLPIALDGTDGVPVGSIIRISGLPRGSVLSSGRPHGETQWDMKTDEIGDLRLALPTHANGEAKFAIQLLAPDNRIITGTATILKVRAAPDADVAVHRVQTQIIPGTVSDHSDQEFDELGAEASPVDPEAAVSTSDIEPLSTKRTAPTKSVPSSDTDWIKPSASVNLRKGPTSSAPVVGVVAKGAKLRVIGRKRGWVEVSNPATSQQGWVYSGHVENLR